VSDFLVVCNGLRVPRSLQLELDEGEQVAPELLRGHFVQVALVGVNLRRRHQNIA
jgi:hypothetical protein